MKAKPILKHERAKQGQSPRQRNDYAPGRVYILKSSQGRVKIGLSRCVENRRRDLSRVYGENLVLVAAVWVFNMKWLENQMHEQFAAINVHQPQHLNGHTEWFEAKGLKINYIKTCLYWRAFVVNFTYFLMAILVLGFVCGILF